MDSFATITFLRARNLYLLLKRAVRWEWTDQHKNAIFEIKSEVNKLLPHHKVPLATFSRMIESRRCSRACLGCRVLTNPENIILTLSGRSTIAESVKYFHRCVA